MLEEHIKDIDNKYNVGDRVYFITQIENLNDKNAYIRVLTGKITSIEFKKDIAYRVSGNDVKEKEILCLNNEKDDNQIHSNDCKMEEIISDCKTEIKDFSKKKSLELLIKLRELLKNV